MFGRKRRNTIAVLIPNGLTSEWVDAELRLHDGDEPLDTQPEPIQVMSRIEGDTISVDIDRQVEWSDIPEAADRAVVYFHGIPIAWITVRGGARRGDSVVITP